MAGAPQRGHAPLGAQGCQVQRGRPDGKGVVARENAVQHASQGVNVRTLVDTLEVRFDEKKSMKATMDNLTELLKERGFDTVSVTKSKFKAQAEFVVTGRLGVRREALVREMNDLQAVKQNAIADWHVE